MKLSELPIYWDLLRLPLPVAFKRIRQRLGGAKQVEISYHTPADLKWAKVSPYPMVGKLNEQKWNFLLDHYCNDEINLLGSGWTSLRNASQPSGFMGYQFGSFPRPELEENTIDWNRDQRTGFQYEINGNAGQELKKAFDTDGIDVKLCWEFARMHHLPQLALGYYHFPERKDEVLKTFERHLVSFNTQCSPGKGIHWTSPMEVAVRLTNILVGFNLLKNELQHISDVVLEMAYGHFIYVSNHLEHKDGFGTNHYLSNLMGLVVAGNFLESAELKEKARWAWTELEKELQKQFFSDGFNFEYSTYYHRLSAEIALVSLKYANKQGFDVDVKTLKTIGQALLSMEVLMKNNHELPKFGDIDSGRILDLNPEGEFESAEFIPQAESCKFVLDLKRSGSVYHSFYQDVTKLLGQASVNSLLARSEVNRTKRTLSHAQEWKIKFPEISAEKIDHYYWPKAGLVLYKSDEFYLAINLMANKNGHRYRGHFHNDKGSFELRVHDKDYILDPGVMSYTSSVEIRNQYRKTSAHPIPFTGVEQNRYLSGFLGLFHSRLDVRARPTRMSDHSMECEVFYQGIKVLRRFEIKSDRVLILDWCNRPFTVNKNNEIPLTAGYGKLL
ncbi:heparinase II/III family protein [Owenweeksia hongkongensis]|uniref:heparinase II/III family protein n=1 Tax=Owenweeksia hongkongensis TaxID=253245 RepID=UPI003A8F2F8F